MTELKIVPYVAPPNARRAMIVDIDGTVALHYNAVGEQLRGHFEYSRVLGDLPNYPVMDIIMALESSRNHTIFVSGREDSCRDDTVEWLGRYGWGKGSYDLHMRKTGDHRPDYIIKYEIFDEHIRDNFDICCAVDDRNQVVRMWRSLGLLTLQVADGDF